MTDFNKLSLRLEERDMQDTYRALFSGGLTIYISNESFLKVRNKQSGGVLFYLVLENSKGIV